MRLVWRTLPCLLASMCVLGGSTSPAALCQSSETPSVKVSLIVTDGSGHSVDDIKQEEIEVIENNLPLKVSLFAKDERPVKYAIAIDTSGSFRSLLGITLRAVKSLVQSNRPEDETMLIRFVDSNNIEKIQEFTADQTALLSIDVNKFTPRGGQTAVIDAVHTAVEATAAYKPGDASVRRAVILISDGEERSSYYSRDQLMKLLREKDVQVFILGVVSELDKEAGLIRRSPRQRAEDLLKQIAEETGGRIFFPNNEKELFEATAEIIHDLHTQYVIGFERPIQSGEEGFRKLKVRSAGKPARKNLKIITRPGYWLSAPKSELQTPRTFTR